MVIRIKQLYFKIAALSSQFLPKNIGHPLAFFYKYNKNAPAKYLSVNQCKFSSQAQQIK